MAEHSNNTNKERVILIIESDQRVRKALQEEMAGDLRGDFYPTFDAVIEAHRIGQLCLNPIAAVVEMRDTTKDELARLTDFFQQLPEMPIYLTLNYDCDFQLQEQYLKAWTKNLLFRPFNIDRLIQALKSINE